MLLKRVTLGVLATGAVVTLGFMLDAGEPGASGWWLLFLGFGAWALLPYGVVALVAIRLGSSLASLRVLLAAALLLTGASSLLLYQAFVVDLDPQSGIVFVFLPVWQLVGLAPFLLLAGWLRSRGQSPAS
jgi:hypothetical protein